MNDHPDWIAQAKALLDESARNIDAATASRLTRARQAALRQRRARMAAWFIPAGFASACMVLLAVVVWHGHAPRTTHDITPVQVGESTGSDVDSADDDEFFEDLDFYTWLEAQDQDSDDNG
jgi:hypothetical protein